VRVDGHDAVFGGTSAVAPLWAALVALINQGRGKPLGYLNPLLYKAGTQGFRDITSGTNGAFTAGPGWDTCTGLGSPKGDALLQLLGTTMTT
jgi:kumamolisin